MDIGQRIKQRRKELGMSADELGSKLGKDRSTIYRYEKGDIENLPLDILEPIAKVLATTPQYLMGWQEKDKMNNVVVSNPLLSYVEKKKFRMLGDIACGEPILANEEIELYVEASTTIHADFCLTAKGDSMIGARIYDGDIVFIRQQEMVQDGEIAAVLINDEATLKRVYYDRENGVLSLYAENPQFKTLRYSGEELENIRILGKAVAFQSVIK